MKRIRKKDFKRITNRKYDGMMGRCYRKTDRSYYNYGAKGIRVCADWIRDIENFRVWTLSILTEMGVSKEEFISNPLKYSLDRIDPTGHYTPINCRYVNAQTQSRNQINKNKNRCLISAEGEEVSV